MDAEVIKILGVYFAGLLVSIIITFRVIAPYHRRGGEPKRIENPFAYLFGCICWPLMVILLLRDITNQ